MRLVFRPIATSAHRRCMSLATYPVSTNSNIAIATRDRCAIHYDFRWPVAASRAYSTPPRSIFDIAKTLKTNEASVEDRVTAINGLDISLSLDSYAKEQQMLDIVNSNALVMLMSILKDNDSIASSQLLVPAFLALIRLSKDPQIAQQLVKLNASAILASFFTQSDPKLHAAACLTLGNVALNPLAAEAVSSSDIVSAALNLLRSPYDAIKRVASTCVANIASSVQGRRQIIDLDGVILVGELLHVKYSDPLRSAAAFALGNIISGGEIDAQDLLRQSGALAALVLLLSPIYDEDVNSSAAWALHHGVHRNVASQSLVAEAGGLAMLVQHLATGASESLQANALLALESAVIMNDHNLDWCRINNAIEVLQRVQETDNDAMNAYAKQALISLLNHL
ncbi:putative armadillo-like helical protein [Plasmopara halstedii]